MPADDLLTVMVESAHDTDAWQHSVAAVFSDQYQRPYGR
jgi:hypothetical protein